MQREEYQQAQTGRELQTTRTDGAQNGDEDYDYSEEEEENCIVPEGSVYTTPGVCQQTVKGLVMARGASFLAQTVYGAPKA